MNGFREPWEKEKNFRKAYLEIFRLRADFEVDVLVGGVIAVVLKLHDVFARGLDVAIHLPPTVRLTAESLHDRAIHAHERHSCGIEIFLRKGVLDESVYMILLGKSQRGCEDKNK